MSLPGIFLGSHLPRLAAIPRPPFDKIAWYPMNLEWPARRLISSSHASRPPPSTIPRVE